MSYESEDPGRNSGCPPHEFGNNLAWHWTRDMSTPLKGGFLTLLYAMRAIASASGQLRFSGDGKPIRIQDIAKAAGCREKDARRFLEAAILAGVVQTIGERRRGKPTLYALLNSPCPNWAAAADYLKSTARPRKAEDANESSGRSGPNSTGIEGSGHSGPNSDDEVRAAEARTEPEGNRATAARMGSGHSGPIGSGHSGPNNPGSTQELPQEMADVVPQPQQRVGERDEGEFPQRQDEHGTAARPDGEDAPVGARRCRCGGGRIVRPDRDVCGGCVKKAKAAEAARKPVQGAFLVSLAGGGQVVPQARREPAPWPKEDLAAPLLVCGCGREHRLRDSDRCPACVVAADEQRIELEAVSNG
ncbi:hypothetical protein ACIA8E_07200 [Streptomyces sp. NPDC051664]|uniref:hypothetical protein n=1 Tax=Streptomyces sp. NPDC051664 TaxID=3365668 RepID=UPI00379FD296